VQVAGVLGVDVGFVPDDLCGEHRADGIEVVTGSGVVEVPH